MELALIGHATSKAIKEDYISVIAKLEGTTEEAIRKRLGDKIKEEVAITKKRLS